MASRAAALLLLLLMIAGCAPSVPGKTEAPRLYSSCAAATSLLLELGAARELAAVDVHSRSLPGAENIPCPGKDGALSEEKIVELGINHAVLWYYHSSSQQVFERRGIPVTSVPPVRLADYPEFVRTIAKLANRETAGETLLERFHADLPEALAPETRKPRVYFELYAPYKAVGGNSYYHDILTLAGGENINADQMLPGAVSPEFIVQSLPEVIFFMAENTTAEEIAARPGFSQLPAVKNRRIYPLNRLELLEGAAPAKAVGLLRSRLFPETL